MALDEKENCVGMLYIVLGTAFASIVVVTILVCTIAWWFLKRENKKLGENEKKKCEAEEEQMKLYLDAVRRMKRIWYNVLFKFGVDDTIERRNYAEFYEEAFRKHKWNKAETFKHPLYMLYFNEDNEVNLEEESWDIFKDFLNKNPKFAYEPRKPTGRKLVQWVKEAWINCLYVDYLGTKKQAYYEDHFEHVAFDIYEWDREETKEHPLFKEHFIKKGREMVMRIKYPNEWYTVETIPNKWAYEPLKIPQIEIEL